MRFWRKRKRQHRTLKAFSQEEITEALEVWGDEIREAMYKDNRFGTATWYVGGLLMVDLFKIMDDIGSVKKKKEK